MFYDTHLSTLNKYILFINRIHDKMVVKEEKEGQGCPSWRVILRENLLVILTVVGVGVGLLVGFTVAPTKPSASALMWIGMPGELYIRTLKLVIIPLVICSVIAGTSAMDPRSNGKISGLTLLYIMVTNLLGCVLGAVLCLIIKPGNGVESNVDTFDRDIMETEDIFADLLRNIFPDNLVSSCFQQAQTKYEYKVLVETRNNGTHNYTVSTKEITKKYLGVATSTNVLGLFIVCAMFGVTAKVMGEQGKPFLAFFRSATDIILKMMRILIWATPVGSASLIARTLAGTSDLGETFRKLGMYTMTCLVSQFIWGLIIMPVFYVIVRRANPLKFLSSIMPSILIVFATSSTMLALPESYNSMEKKNGVDKRISRFVAPLSATIGRAGSANYMAASCIFLIQMVYNTVEPVDAILVIVLVWVSTLAIPSVSSASLVTILILLTALKIPGESAAMLFALEFLLDRVRSDVNIITQLTGVVTVQRFCASNLPPTEADLEVDDVKRKSIVPEEKTKGVPNDIAYDKPRKTEAPGKIQDLSCHL